MNQRPFSLVFCLSCIVGSICCGPQRALAQQSPETEEKATEQASDVSFLIGGVGGAYFLASPGTLVIDLEKRERNRSSRQTELRAILVGPDRRVLQQAAIPDDGQPSGSGPGPPQRVRLSTRVDRAGVYGLNITVSQDRYGQEIVWGFRTNCPHYLIETSRGHKDERHQEPIVLLKPDRPGNVSFLPRTGAFSLDVSGLPGGVQALQVYDGNDSLIESLPVGSDGQASHTFPADPQRGDSPWRLHLPAQQATVQINGVTRWESTDRYPDLSCWTPDPSSHFPLLDYRWLLTPYSRQLYGPPGERKVTVFQLHNNSRHTRTILLDVEFPDAQWPVQLSAKRVELGPNKAATVVVQYTVPAEGQTRTCHMRATPEEDPQYSTYSTLTVRAGVAPATQPLEMPIVLEPYRHENEQFGYAPVYPLDNQMYFDLDNRPMVRTGGGVAKWSGGDWAKLDLASRMTSQSPSLKSRSFGMPSTKVAHDADGNLYLLATAGRTAALLHSADGGETFSGCAIDGRESQSRSFDIEQPSGHNVPSGPPPILRYTKTAADPKLFWRRINDLELFLPDKKGDGLSLGEPILISRLCIGLASHSGIPSSVVSRGSKVHVVWAEATEPEAKVSGVPTYVATYDRLTGTLGEPALVGYGAPPNDIHNSPSITMDSQGYLHVLAGTHGQPFQYARSLKPNDAHAGWTEPVPVGEGLRQTYIGLVCGADDTLHLVFRMWRSNVEPHPLSHHAVLAYQKKPPGRPWESPRVLIVSPFSEYSVFYHRLTIDRLGRLFLSYDYWSTHWFYRNDHRGSRRSVLMSDDGGDTWKLADEADFRAGVTQTSAPAGVN